MLALDQRGHGESGWATDYQVERFVADIDAFVRALDLAPVILVGMSMGGRNAFHYAGAYPESVAKLVLGDIGRRSRRTAARALMRASSSTTSSPPRRKRWSGL